MIYIRNGRVKNRLMAEVHFYDPYIFTLMEKDADSVIWSFYIGAAILILCVIYTTMKVKEWNPQQYADDIVGRVKTYETIVKGDPVPKAGVPESFKVLFKELQSLGLDIKVLDADKNEIDLRQTYEEDDEYGQAAGEDTFEYVAEDGSLDDGFTTKDIDEDSEFYADKDDEDDFDIDFNENDADDSFDE